MIEDNKPNFLHYSADKCVHGRELFRGYVNPLFDIKKNYSKCGHAKAILNIMSGLCGAHVYQEAYGTEEEPVDVGGMDIKELHPIGDDPETCTQFRVKYINTQKQIFKYPFCRISPFMTAFGRMEILKIVLPYEDQIVLIHTDGFISKTKLDIEVGDGNLGDLKFEKYSKKIKVFHVNKVIDLVTEKKF